VIDDGRRILRTAPLVAEQEARTLVDGRPAGMITRQDVLTYLAGPA